MNAVAILNEPTPPLRSPLVRLHSTSTSPTRSRRVKKHDSCSTLTKDMIAKAFVKRTPRQHQPEENPSPCCSSNDTKQFSESFSTICVENGLGTPVRRRPASNFASPRRTRSSSSTSQLSSPRKRKDCFQRSKLLASDVLPPLPLAEERQKKGDLPEKDRSIGKKSLQAYEQHKKHFATCRPSRRRVQFSEKLDDGPQHQARVDEIAHNDLQLPPGSRTSLGQVGSPVSADKEDTHAEASELLRLQRELRKASGKIDQLVNVIATDSEEARRIEAENKMLRRQLRRKNQQSRNRGHKSKCRTEYV